MTVTSKNGKPENSPLHRREYRLTVSDVFWRSGGIRDAIILTRRACLSYGEAGFYMLIKNGIRLLSLRSYGKGNVLEAKEKTR